MTIPNITVFVPAYNAEDFISDCMTSISRQVHGGPFNVMFVDDASTDKTREYMDEFTAITGLPSAVVHNGENMKMPYNLRYAQLGDPEDVIIILDADDWLAHDRVLGRLSKAFEDPNLWLTYGSYARNDGLPVQNPALPYPPDVILNREFRSYPTQMFNHPLCFRRKLLQQIEDWELQDDEGNWFQWCYDHVIMMPMLEMAVGHFKWMPEVLYVYNEDNPISECKLDHGNERTVEIVNNRPPRLPLCPHMPLGDLHQQFHELRS